MPVNVLMPALSPTMEKGKLAKWLKKEGDRIKSGDVLAEIETDKATMEVEAVDEGILGKLLVAAGTDDVAVNTPIAVILGDGEKPGDAPAASAPKPAPAAAPAAPAATAQSPAPPAKPAGGRVFASPLARRIAKQKGVDIAALLGSGPHGRIVAKDVERPGSEVSAPAASAMASAAPAASDKAILKLFAEGSFELVPHDSMRKTIARRLIEAKQTIPHFYVSVDVGLDQILDVRERLNLQAPKDKDGKPLWKISVNDFIIKAMAMALIRVPDANVAWTEQAMVRHKHADIGVAVSIPGGLITPVVRRADTKGLAQISAEMRDYAARARSRKLKPEEYTGGSASVSNMGMMNVKTFAAIINPPQASILAIGSAERRPVVRGHDIKIEQQMTITLSADHRCIDGALGAEFIGVIKAYLEEPGLMLV
ncbi:pyruvate dehydrogenase complex dihydrolipoamide acetyltransferase [Aestuariivirga sp.]|jgi:pyruvate dehydrogenase E2 component (dihydrolipoamide acetyltransferase)|uniref:pyruvate dehydrogenase complex dihydrolipoamide acetyltransferase n=1 Tax=Aestuariivirga sp. TaxID=2650926 RepID=UPI0037841C0B